MKIKTKLVLLFTMITVSSLLVTGIISFNNAKKALEDAAYNSLELVNNAYISNITHIIQLRHEQTKEIAGTYLVRHLNPSGPTPDSVISKIQEHIISILEELKVAKTIEVHDELHRATDIEEIDIIDKNGTILSSTNEAVIGKKIPERFIYIVKKEGSWFGGYNYDPETGEMFLNFYQGVLSYKDKKISGIVLLKVRAGILNEISDNQSSLWKSQELLIGHKRNDSITYITSLRNKEEYVRYSETPMTLAVNGNEGKGEMLDYRNKKVLAVWQYNKNTGWGIVSKVDIEDINAPIINLQYLVTIVAFIILIIVILIAFYFADSVAKPIQSLVTTFVKISQGELTPPKVVKGTFEITQLSSIANNTVVFLKGYINKLSKIASSDFSDVNKPIDEKDEIGLSLYEMSVSLKNYHENQQRDLWMEKGINEIIASTKEETNLNELCNNILQHSIPYVNAHIGALYIYDHLESVLLLKGSYALSKKKNFKDKLKIGEGLSGQAVVEQKTKIIKNLPGDFDKINSGFVDITINELVIIPLIFHKLLVGVIEVGSANSFTELQMEFLNRSSDLISAAVSSALDRDLIENLLTDSKISAEQLQ
ncbi:MAG: GAF domain-containing protein, partial [Cyclobacteriaceae bacterium]|nr:GAF domain-containing protein [Cyclobacteriaceae bacterium]